MFFKKQIVIREHSALVAELFARRGFDANKIKELSLLADHFEIRLPLIGGFSSGKSSLVNALVKDHLLSTEVTPETAVPAEIRYGLAPAFKGCFPDGRTLDLTKEQIANNLLSELQPDGWLSIQSPSDSLSHIPHLVLVDMPGWGSGIDAHERVIDAYIDRSLAYVVVVSVEEGVLRESLRAALLELAMKDKPVILVLTKAHKRAAEDSAAVLQQLRKDITQLLGYSPEYVVKTSALRNDITEFEDALFALESQAEVIFNKSVVSAWCGELQRAFQLGSLLATQEFKNAELIKAEIEIFEQKMEEFDARLRQETEALEARIGPILSAIRLRVENSLVNRLDSLTDRALSGVKITDDILGTARLEVAKAVKDEFEPALRRYLDRLVDALPTNLNINLDFSLKSTPSSSANSASIGLKDIASLLAPILGKLSNPIAKFAAMILPFVASLFDNKADEVRQEIQEARQREKVKTQIRLALIEAAEQIEAQLRPIIKDQIQEAKDVISKNILSERQDIERTLITKRHALEQGEAEVAAQREEALTDIKNIEGWLGCVTEGLSL